MSNVVVMTALQAWLIVFVPLGILGVGMWALWRLIPRFRKSMGYKGYRPR